MVELSAAQARSVRAARRSSDGGDLLLPGGTAARFRIHARVYGPGGSGSVRQFVCGGARRYGADSARVSSGGGVSRVHVELHVDSGGRGADVRCVVGRSEAYVD